MNLYTYIGLANGKSVDLLLGEDGSSGTCRLTRAVSETDAESNAIDVEPSSGLVLLIRGIRCGDWICSAVIVEQATELQSIIAQAAFGRPPIFPSG